jgi:hypothetical protein
MRGAKIHLFLSTLVLASCAAPRSQVNALQAGMTQEQVVGIMGEPDSTRLRNGENCLMYSL